MPTSVEFDVIDTVAVIRLDEIRVHTSKPQSTQIEKRSKPACRIANTAVYTTSRNSGWTIDHVNPSAELL